MEEEAMPEFRIENDALRRDARFRVLSWGTVLLLLAVATFLLALRDSGYIGDSSALRSLFFLTIISAAVTAIFLAPREGLRRVESKMVFALDDNRIIRRRQGYPDVEVAFSEIETLREELRWLVVVSTEPQRKIAVPRDVSGYELIRAELAKHHPLSPRVTSPLKGKALLTVSALSWAGVLWFRDVRAIIAAGIVAVVTLGFGSYRVWTLLYRRSRRRLLWISLGLAWLVALLLIYLRLVRP
jgi:hypothetical protein